jgi:two-component system response regulator NreC
VRTVESHRARIQGKLGRSTRAELVRYALDHGLLER